VFSTRLHTYSRFVPRTLPLVAAIGVIMRESGVVSLDMTDSSLTPEALAIMSARPPSQDALSAAIALAATAHAGQVDKGGRPYILHVLRVMLACQTEQERTVAALHDVVEDCGYTVSDIRAQFGGAVAAGVDAMTRRDGESYTAFIERCASDPIARVVKLADLADNMDVSRLGREITDEDGRRLRKYAAARDLLIGSMAG